MDRHGLGQKIVILGSTGSIGQQALDVVMKRPDDFSIVGLVAFSDADQLRSQAEETQPEFICLVDESAASRLRDDLDSTAGPKPVILAGEAGLLAAAAWDGADTVLNAIVGGAGLAGTLAALEAGKKLALANKESLVAGGQLVKKALEGGSGSLIPVDSEHSALWQCLVGEDRSEVARLLLTASGGPFWGRDASELTEVTVAEALAHPRWDMGRRISIDSATLLNKGLEVIEAHELYGVEYDLIDVVIHPQSIVHSLVEFVDGSLKAQLGPTDMRLPILYALSWPKRVGPILPAFDLTTVGDLVFESLEPGWAPCFDLAVAAGRAGRSYPAVLNAADEVAVAAFLSGLIRFQDIGNIIDCVLTDHKPSDIHSVGDFIEIDERARVAAQRSIESIETTAIGSAGNTILKRGFAV